MCEKHGNTTFIKGECYKCKYPPRTIYKTCDKHGDTAPHTSNGDCKACLFEKNKNLSVQHCEIHGETSFSNDKCLKCSVNKSYSASYCSIHGEGKHKNGNCMACLNYRTHHITTQHCVHHGDIKHVDNQCYSCLVDNHPKIKKLIDSIVMCAGTKNNQFTCPDCDNILYKKMNDIITLMMGDNNISDDEILHKLCKSCRDYHNFLNMDYTKEAQRFLPDFNNVSTKIRSTKDNRDFSFRCPDCGHVFTMKFTSFVKRYQKGKGICNNC